MTTKNVLITTIKQIFTAKIIFFLIVYVMINIFGKFISNWYSHKI